MNINKSKNICFPFVGDSVGGSHVSSVLLINQLLKKKKKVTIIVHKKGKLEKFLNKKKIKYFLFPTPYLVGASSFSFFNFLNLCISFPFICCAILKYKIDIIHTNDMKIHQTWVLPSFFLKKRQIWHQRTLFSQSRLSKLLIRFSTDIICISKYVKTSIPNQVISKVEIIYNSIENYKKKINIKKLRNKILNKYQKKTKIISFVGNLQQIKQPNFLIELAYKLKLEKIDFIFCFFGSDKEFLINKMKTLIRKLGISKNIKFMGFKSPIEPWIKSSHVLVASSKGDGFGRTIIEAMNLQVPVIASNFGGHKEIIKNKVNGILCDTKDTDNFAKLLKELVYNKGLRKKITYKAFIFSKKFYSSKQFNKFKKYYE